MEFFVLAVLIAVVAFLLKSKDSSRRIALLGRHLGQYQIEKLMESLTEGYQRALGESDEERRAQIWHLLDSTESKLSEQFNSFAAEFSTVDEREARVSKLPIAIPFADKLLPDATFDLRKLLLVHAQGISDAAKNSGQRTPKGKIGRAHV